MLNQWICDYVAEAAAKPTESQFWRTRLSRVFEGTDLGRCWSTDRRTDGVSGLDQDENRRMARSL